MDVDKAPKVRPVDIGISVILYYVYTLDMRREGVVKTGKDW